MTLKGRHWIALWLGWFLVVAASVVWRQTAALQTARELRALEAARGALETSRAAAAAAVRRARSRAVLEPIARARLGLRSPNDTEIVILQRPGSR